uniref:hypothetical protein n=1 Tax=Klebsiella pneumoniae TaxID=573 RepID=UPI001954B67E
ALSSGRRIDKTKAIPPESTASARASATARNLNGRSAIQDLQLKLLDIAAENETIALPGGRIDLVQTPSQGADSRPVSA